MKKILNIIVSCLFLLIFTHNLSSQNWQWSSSYGSIDQDGGTAIVADKNKNLYVSGSFWGGTCYLNTDTLAANGHGDFFLVKYDNAGNEIWIKQFGGNNSSSYFEGIADLFYDSINDFIYATGRFYGNCNFGNGVMLSGGQEFFLAKFDLNGNCIWAKQSTGTGKANGLGVTLDNSNNIYVTGTNTDSIKLGNTPKIARGGFIAKFDANGNCSWAKKKFRYIYYSAVSQDSEIIPNGIKIYNSNILVAGGTINDTVVVDTITKIQSSLYSGVLSCFDLNADVKWLKIIGGNASNTGLGFSIDSVGNSYIAGRFVATGIFDSITLTNSLQYDAYIAKYNINGQIKWAKQLNASAGGEAYNIWSNNKGYTYITGHFKGNANFGSNNVTSSTNKDMFVARYDSNGVCLGYKNFGEASGLSVYGTDNNSFWVQGQFWNSITIGSNSYSSYGQSDCFVAKCDALTSIEENRMAINNQLVIYANPSKGSCNITIPDEFKTKKNLQLTIYDIQGKVIQQQTVEINQEKVKVNIEQEAKGIYSVTLSDGNKVYNGKIVFE